MVSKTGMYVKYENDRFRPTANKSEAVKLHIISVTNNTAYPYALQIQRQGSSKAMNPHGGTANNSIGEDQTGDGGNSILFDLLEDSNDVEFYLQFSSYGREALYDNGTAPVAKQPAGGEARPAEKGYLWTKTRTERGWTLKSDKGKLLSIDPASGSVSLIDLPAAPSRSTILRETTDINGVKWPKLYTEAAPPCGTTSGSATPAAPSCP